MLKRKKKKSSELYATIAVVSPGGCHEEAHLSDFTAAFRFVVIPQNIVWLSMRKQVSSTGYC